MGAVTMRLKIMKKFLLLMALALCCLNFTRCTGNECSATQTIESDPDSDCAVGTEDNCPDVYNPNQDDTDEDDYGDACEAPECVNTSDCVGLNFVFQETAYNLRGLYEATAQTQQSAAACVNFETFSLQQTDSSITITNAIDKTLNGQIDSSITSDEVNSTFANDTQSCQMTFTTTDFNYKIECYNKELKEFCESVGIRTIIEVSGS